MFVLIVTLILLIYFIYIYHRLTSSVLYGLWVCDPEFCAETGIESMWVTMGNNGRACVVVSVDNKVAYTDTFTYSLWRFPLLNYNTTMKIKSDTESEVFPEYMNAHINLTEGTMVWSDKKTEYARLVRTYVSSS